MGFAACDRHGAPCPCPCSRQCPKTHCRAHLMRLAVAEDMHTSSVANVSIDTANVGGCCSHPHGDQGSHCCASHGLPEGGDE